MRLIARPDLDRNSPLIFFCLKEASASWRFIDLVPRVVGHHIMSVDFLGCPVACRNVLCTPTRRKRMQLFCYLFGKLELHHAFFHFISTDRFHIFGCPLKSKNRRRRSKKTWAAIYVALFFPGSTCVQVDKEHGQGMHTRYRRPLKTTSWTTPISYTLSYSVFSFLCFLPLNFLLVLSCINVPVWTDETGSTTASNEALICCYSGNYLGSWKKGCPVISLKTRLYQ